MVYRPMDKSERPTPPRKKLEAQAAVNAGFDFFQFLESLPQSNGGWFANLPLQRPRSSRSGCTLRLLRVGALSLRG
jgi:hypothetical protein